MNVLGLDPSLNATGFSYRAPTGAGTITGIIDPKPLRGPARLLYCRTKFLQILDTAKPDLVVYEGYAMGAMGNTFDMGEMGGVFKVEMFERGIPFLEVPPSNLKMFALGAGGIGVATKGLKGDAKRKAAKAAMVDAATAALGRRLRTDDEADAYHLMRMGYVYLDPKSRPRLRGHHQNLALVKCELFQR